MTREQALAIQLILDDAIDRLLAALPLLAQTDAVTIAEKTTEAMHAVSEARRLCLDIRFGPGD